MKRIATIVCPARRAARANYCAREAQHAGASTDFNVLLQSFQMMFTPAPLRHLCDHAARGQKSLTRADQFINRRHFKARPAGASGIRCS